jgi:hypothetical protein
MFGGEDGGFAVGSLGGDPEIAIALQREPQALAKQSALVGDQDVKDPAVARSGRAWRCVTVTAAEHGAIGHRLPLPANAAKPPLSSQGDCLIT